MSERDIMFNERDCTCTTVQLMHSTDPSYDSQNHRWIARNSRDVSRVMKTKFPATVMVFGVVSSEGHIMVESQHQSVPGCDEECGDPLVQSGDRWQTLGVAAGLGTRPQIQRDPGLASEGVL